MRPDEVIAQIVAHTEANVQERTRMGMLTVLSLLERGGSITDAESVAGVERRTIDSWRRRYPLFGTEVVRILDRNKQRSREAREEKKRETLESKGLVLRYDEEVPDRGTFPDFRWKYFGRPTWPHQKALTVALEDPTNLYTFVFGPTGMGKDTIAGDYVAYESCPDRTGLRVGWFMETGPFSERRLGRLARYLTDTASYWLAPSDTPGAQKPTATLIDDYGPFAWEPGMVWEDGTEVARTRFTSNAIYYPRVVAPEQDPNLWATGVGGATYGSRMGLCVCSDIFTTENQKSPTERHEQYGWLDGTLDTRLDALGRLLVIGTWLPVEHNYELLLEAYTEGAHIIRQERYGPGVYTKYSNGVAVVIIKAIWTNPDTGEDESYWPQRFPLEDQLLLTDGTSLPVEGLSDAELLEVTDSGAKRQRGLRSKQARSPIVFKALYQQERERDVEAADFTDEVLDAAMDPTRSFGMVRPSEIRLWTVDPAKRYGAAGALLLVDRELETITLGDFIVADNLGYTGIKNQLILNPLARWEPAWLCYEDNREGSILADTVIWQTINSAGVRVFTHTTGLERGHIEHGPGFLASWMLSGRFRIPAATALDRARADIVRSHFKAWDRNPERSKPGRAGHDPDDLCMACWVGSLKGRTLIEKRSTFRKRVGVPAAIARRFDQLAHPQHTRGASGRLQPRDTLPRPDRDQMLAHLTGEADDQPL